MRWSSVLKFFLGVLLALAILGGAGVVAARVMMARLSVLPPKPTFPNDTPAGKPAPKPAAKPAADKPDATKPDTASKPLPPGAFQARSGLWCEMLQAWRELRSEVLILMSVSR